MPRLTTAERAAFLAEPGVLMRIAVVRADGSPLVTPLWFILEDDAIYDLGADDVWRDRYRRIARRYVPADAAEAYIHTTIDQPRALFRVVFARANVRGWRMPLGDEPGDGIWHQRYYVEGSRLKQK